MIFELLILGIIIGLITGGKIYRVTDAQYNKLWVLFIPVIVHAIIVTSLHFGIFKHELWVAWVTHYISFPAIIVACLLNRNIPGAYIVILGVALNLVAISFNGGLMPVDKASIEYIFGSEYLQKLPATEIAFTPFIGPETKFAFLCDIIPSKRFFLLLPSVYSIGDVFITFGFVTAIISLMHKPLKRELVTPAEA